MSRNNDIFLRVQKSLNERFGPEQSEYVDLGLHSGTLWATCNIGAKSPEESGLYFAWGETKGYTAVQVGKDRQFNKGSYEYLDDNSIYDSHGNLKPEFDAATVNLGDEWRMPTQDEFFELLELENEWVEDDETGVKGRLFIGYNGKTLFLPAAGIALAGQLDGVGRYGACWSSSLSENNDLYAHTLNINESVRYWSGTYRFVGYSIRPVCG